MSTQPRTQVAAPAPAPRASRQPYAQQDAALQSLPPAVNGDRRYLDFQGRRLAFYFSAPSGAGSFIGVPLLLLHSISAAASAAEVKPLFDWYAPRRPVFALELPGFGASDRSRVNYTPQMMSDAILQMLAQVRQMGFDEPVDVLAVSLSCEIATRAALARPQDIRSVAMVSPTGLESKTLERFADGRTKDKPWLRWLLESGPWAQALFRQLTREKSMRKFLQRAWGSEFIDEGLLHYNRLIVQRPGARHAPYAFISGALFTRGVAHLYAQLNQPVWVAHGVHGEFANFDGLATLGPPPKWKVDEFETGAMPHFERTAMFASRYDAFLRKLPPHF